MSGSARVSDTGKSSSCFFSLRVSCFCRLMTWGGSSTALGGGWEGGAEGGGAAILSGGPSPLPRPKGGPPPGGELRGGMSGPNSSIHKLAPGPGPGPRPRPPRPPWKEPGKLPLPKPRPPYTPPPMWGGGLHSMPSGGPMLRCSMSRMGPMWSKGAPCRGPGGLSKVGRSARCGGGPHMSPPGPGRSPRPSSVRASLPPRSTTSFPSLSLSRPST
mmetsp:Transcript_31051/g.68931  ORF Transcript_31051/g.68931 Transcript_31051/m.68931 type:complete len:215 (-) Transcript_31051:703-1347(-)